MSWRRDLLGRIADARAAMMLRGYRSMRLDLGPRARAEIKDSIDVINAWPEVRAILIRDDMEGFAMRMLDADY
jgi:hypothetical protein